MDDATRQRIFGAVVQLPDAAAVESLLADFEVSAEQKLRLEVFDGEADGVSGCLPRPEKTAGSRAADASASAGALNTARPRHCNQNRASHRFPKLRLNIA